MYGHTKRCGWNKAYLFGPASLLNPTEALPLWNEKKNAWWSYVNGKASDASGFHQPDEIGRTDIWDFHEKNPITCLVWDLNVKSMHCEPNTFLPELIRLCLQVQDFSDLCATMLHHYMPHYLSIEGIQFTVYECKIKLHWKYEFVAVFL